MPKWLEFWRKYNIEYNQVNPSPEIVDDVEIYFDNRIGIVAPQEYELKVKSKPKVVADPQGDYGDNRFKYNILKVIEKRNQEEEAIAELIQDFEKKIEDFFNYIRTDDLGKRLIAKIKDGGQAFSQDEIYTDFGKIYRKYTVLKKDLGDFFKRETKDSLHQLCDDFERTIIS